MKRFAVVRHANQHSRICVHELLRSYHWESLDGESVLMLCDVAPGALEGLEAHPDVFVLPSLYSAQPVAAMAKRRDKHDLFLRLGVLGVTESHVSGNVAEMAVSHYGVKFSLDL